MRRLVKRLPGSITRQAFLIAGIGNNVNLLPLNRVTGLTIRWAEYTVIFQAHPELWILFYNSTNNFKWSANRIANATIVSVGLA